MGSPLSPILANAFLCHFEKKWLSGCPQEFLPIVFKRFVDDVFVTFLRRTQLSEFVFYMNTKHPNIKFTSEFQEDHFFSILDIKIIRKDHRLITSIFCKTTFSGVFTNFNSFLPVTYKSGLVYTLLHLCFQMCSTYEKFHEEIVLLKDIFKRNEYPETFIDKCITNFWINYLFPIRLYILQKKSGFDSVNFSWSFIFWDKVPVTKMFEKLHSLLFFEGCLSIKKQNFYGFWI